MNTRNSLVSPLPSTVLDALQRARKLIAKREHWTQRAPARDANGDPVEARSPGAVSWCSMGAIINVLPHDACENSKFHKKMRDGCYGLLYEAIECTTSKRGASIMRFNDDHSHKDVLLMFDTAIQLAGGGPR